MEPPFLSPYQPVIPPARNIKRTSDTRDVNRKIRYDDITTIRRLYIQAITGAASLGHYCIPVNLTFDQPQGIDIELATQNLHNLIQELKAAGYRIKSRFTTSPSGTSLDVTISWDRAGE